MSDRIQPGGATGPGESDPVPDGSQIGIDAETAPLDPVVQAHIGRELRALFDGIVHEPVPDRFLQLLQKLEDKKLDPA